MTDDAALDRFLAASPYTEPVDLKKLRFIFRAIDDHARDSGRPAGDFDILELACGVGGVTLPLASLGCHVRALDIDEGDVASLSRAAAEGGFDNVDVTVEDALRYDEEVEYDVVVASEVFEHVLEPRRLAGVVARRTAPGGLLIVTTPNGYGPWEMKNSLSLAPRRWSLLRRVLGKPPHAAGGREHEQRYTRRGLSDIFAGEGFTLVSSRNSDFILTVCRPLRRHRVFGAIDSKLGDLVPHWAASGWYLAFRRGNS